MGESIPIEARIFAVADALDAMTSDRPYRKAMPFSSAMEIIEGESGRQFDGKVVEALLRIPEEELLMNAGSLQGKKPTTCNCFTI